MKEKAPNAQLYFLQLQCHAPNYNVKTMAHVKRIYLGEDIVSAKRDMLETTVN